MSKFNDLKKLTNTIRGLVNPNEVPKDTCIVCREKFSDENVYSSAGWREIKITQMCEKCFDDATKEPEDE